MSLFKLVYADKKSGDTKRCLYASTTGIPSDTDTKVIYDPEFTYGEGSSDKCYLYNCLTADGKAGFKVSNSRNQVPTDADVQTVAYSNNINILTGDAYSPAVTKYRLKVGTSVNATGVKNFCVDVSGTKSYFIENEVITHPYIEVPIGSTVTLSDEPVREGTRQYYIESTLWNEEDTTQGAHTTTTFTVNSDVFVFVSAALQPVKVSIGTDSSAIGVSGLAINNITSSGTTNMISEEKIVNSEVIYTPNSSLKFTIEAVQAGAKQFNTPSLKYNTVDSLEGAQDMSLTTPYTITQSIYLFTSAEPQTENSVYISLGDTTGLTTSNVDNFTVNNAGETDFPIIVNGSVQETYKVNLGTIGNTAHMELTAQPDHTVQGIYFNTKEDRFVMDEDHRLKDDDPTMKGQAEWEVTKNIYLYPYVS